MPNGSVSRGKRRRSSAASGRCAGVESSIGYNVSRRRFAMLRTTTYQKISLLVLIALLSISQAGSVSAGTNVWTSNGPEGGSITALAIDPVTPTTLYAVTWSNGMFKSTNGGGNWNAVN